MEFIFLIFIVIIIVAFAAGRNAQRYHGAGEGTDTRNIADYGHPVKSLYTSTEIQHIITLSDAREISILLRQQKDKLKREQQEKAVILNELQAHIHVLPGSFLIILQCR